MVIKMLASYGDWESPITSESISTQSKTLKSPRVSPATGRHFYVESRDDGSFGIFEITKDGVNDILPTQYSAQNTVYEYGGTAVEVLHNGKIIFSNKDDTVKVLDPEKGKVADLVSDPVLRYSDFNANKITPWIVVNEEDHTIDNPYGIKNNVAAINVDTGEVKRVITGADFYWVPQISPDGTKIAWLEWNFPEMPFDAARLYWADFKDGSASNIELIAGDKLEGVVEPRFGPDGAFYFGRETGEYRSLARVAPGSREAKDIKLEGLGNAAFGELRWHQGSRTYAPLSSRSVVASVVDHGTSKIVAINLVDNSWRQIADPDIASQLQYDSLVRVNDESVLIVCSGYTSPSALRRFHIEDSSKNELIRESMKLEFPQQLFSKPELVSIDSTDGTNRKIHGFLWRPRNDKFTAPDGELPPLIIESHGGPTGHSGPGLKMQTQYFTSRGYARLLLNYRGSTGHGRGYRQCLFENWGVYDADDAADFANHFVKAGISRPGAVGITGLSAGGYNTLVCVVRHPDTFAGGVCVSGISELETFDKLTHKLEAEYTAALVLRKNGSQAEKEARFLERSPLYHIDKVKAPLCLLHGEADSVVPISQATDMADALEKKGGDVKMVAVPGDGHMLAKPGSVRTWLEEEEGWWRKSLLRKN